MFNMIYSEALKLKRSYIMIIVLIGGIIDAAFMALGNKVAGITMSFEKFAFNIQQGNLLILYIIIFSLIIGCVFSREFIYKTANIIYAYPISRTKIFVAKLIIVYMLVFLIYSLQIIATVLSYYIADGILISGTYLVNDIKINMISMLFQFLLIPIPILIAIISKNMMLPIGYGIFGFMISAFFGTSEIIFSKYIPLLAPFYIASDFYISDFSNINSVIVSSIICFALFMTICIYKFNKQDII